MNILLIVLYVIFAVGGSTLIKFSGTNQAGALLSIPIVNISMSLTLIGGVIAYGVSFLLYIILLNKFDLSFISPLTVGIVYVLLMLTAVFFFKEQFTVVKTIGCALILAGILMIVAGSDRL